MPPPVGPSFCGEPTAVPSSGSSGTERGLLAHSLLRWSRWTHTGAPPAGTPVSTCWSSDSSGAASATCLSEPHCWPILLFARPPRLIAKRTRMHLQLCDGSPMGKAARRTSLRWHNPGPEDSAAALSIVERIRPCRLLLVLLLSAAVPRGADHHIQLLRPSGARIKHYRLTPLWHPLNQCDCAAGHFDPTVAEPVVGLDWAVRDALCCRPLLFGGTKFI